MLPEDGEDAANAGTGGEGKGRLQQPPVPLHHLCTPKRGGGGGLAAVPPHPYALRHRHGMLLCRRSHVAVVPSDRLEIEHLIWPQRHRCGRAERAHGRTSLQRPQRGGLAAPKHRVCLFLSLSRVLFITLVGFFFFIIIIVMITPAEL